MSILVDKVSERFKSDRASHVEFKWRRKRTWKTRPEKSVGVRGKAGVMANSAELKIVIRDCG